jgi:hypothetical protein
MSGGRSVPRVRLRAAPLRAVGVSLTSVCARPGAHRAERFPAEEVDVEVVDLLAAVRLAVDDEAVPVVQEPFLRGDGAGGREQPAQRRLVVFGDVGGGRDDVVRYEEDVDGGLRVDVAEGGDEVVAVHDVGADLAAHDLEEEGVVGHGPSVRHRRRWSPTRLTSRPCHRVDCGSR